MTVAAVPEVAEAAAGRAAAGRAAPAVPPKKRVARRRVTTVTSPPRGAAPPPPVEPEPRPDRGPTQVQLIGQPRPGPVAVGGGFLLGVLFWGWIVLPFLGQGGHGPGGVTGVRNMLRAKFFNKGADGAWLA